MKDLGSKSLTLSNPAGGHFVFESELGTVTLSSKAKIEQNNKTRIQGRIVRLG